MSMVDIVTPRWVTPPERCRVVARTSAQQPAVPPERWSEIVARVEHEGIRPIARDLGVSHEAIRSVLRAAGHADLLADTERKSRLAALAPAPPAPPRKVPVERYPEVVRLCEHHTQAEVAAMFGVSQFTVWRIVKQCRRQVAS